MDINELADKYFHECGKIVKPLDLKQNAPNLYHYTNFDSLKSILKNRNLWLTDYRHLSDATEIKFGINILEQRIQLYIKELKNDQVFATWLLDLLFMIPEIPNFYSTYVFCFCEERDHLPAWRYFANQGAGFSLGFKSDCFKSENSQNSNKYPPLSKVEYFLKETRENIRSLPESTIIKLIEKTREYHNKLNPNQTKHKQALKTMLISNFLLLLPLFKTDGYKEEKEYRLIYPEIVDQYGNIYPNPLLTDDKRIFQSQQNNTLFPFVDRKESYIPRIISDQFGHDSIFEIIVGPACNFMQARTEIQRLLDEFGYVKDSMLIRPSDNKLNIIAINRINEYNNPTGY